MGKPTLDMYKFLQAGFDHFNASLFNGQLTPVLLTLQREKQTMGYFSSKRWTNKDGTYHHEISVNPQYFVTTRPLELLQTLVHEMCHQWQADYGKPSRNGYHNKEWADKMESIGLIPSSTGKVGGKRTGQSMSDYPIVNGRFYKASIDFAEKGYRLPFIDTHYAVPKNGVTEGHPVEDALLIPFSQQFNVEQADQNYLQAAKKKKLSYVCPNCAMKVWGKPNLSVICGDCKETLISC